MISKERMELYRTRLYIFSFTTVIVLPFIGMIGIIILDWGIVLKALLIHTVTIALPAAMIFSEEDLK